MVEAYRKEGYYVSFYNFEDKVKAGLNFPKRVRFHDVTLRDGEQQAGVVFRKAEKVRIARALSEAGVDRIEAGLPSVSKDDAEATKEIAHLGLQAKVFAFSRCMKADVDNALKVDVDGLVMEIPSSDHLIKYGYGWDEEKAIGLAVEATDYAHRHGLYVAFFTIDSTRADFKVFWRLISQVATKGHMDSLVVADTFGVMNPQAYAHFVKKIKEVTKKPVEIHAHNDFGLGVANTLAGLGAGAEVAHVTVNGLGERSGNASLEELAVALEMLYGVKTNIELERLRDLSKLVEGLSGVMLTPQKAVVGDRLFETESGIIAGWWSRVEKLGMPLEMFPFLPSVVGQDPVKIAIGKKSGRDSVFYKADKLGLKVDETKVDNILVALKEEAIRRKRTLSDQEFSQIVKRAGR